MLWDLEYTDAYMMYGAYVCGLGCHFWEPGHRAHESECMGTVWWYCNSASIANSFCNSKGFIGPYLCCFSTLSYSLVVHEASVVGRVTCSVVCMEVLQRWQATVGALYRTVCRSCVA